MKNMTDANHRARLQAIDRIPGWRPWHAEFGSVAERVQRAKDLLQQDLEVVMLAPLRTRIFNVIVRWLGEAYDARGRMGLDNPDYRNLQDVEKLVDAIMAVINEGE